MIKDLAIKNNIEELLVFKNQEQDKGTLWMTQKSIAKLFDVDRTVITKHLKNIFEANELDKNSVCAFFAHTANNGKTYKTKL